MTKSSAVSEVIANAPDLPLIFTTGFISRIATGIDDRPNHFYMTGSMGLALSLGTGVALGTRRTTLVVDGDGSMLMNPASLIAAGAERGLPLVQVVLDDGRYDSTGGQTTPGHSVDLTTWARTCGFSEAHTSEELDHFSRLLKAAVSGCATPVFIRCIVEPDTSPPPPRVTRPLTEIAERFSAFLGDS